jgi:hypothetical protein
LMSRASRSCSTLSDAPPGRPITPGFGVEMVGRASGTNTTPPKAWTYRPIRGHVLRVL